jgi:hypothetical protein
VEVVENVDTEGIRISKTSADVKHQWCEGLVINFANKTGDVEERVGLGANVA